MYTHYLLNSKFHCCADVCYLFLQAAVCLAGLLMGVEEAGEM